MTVDALCIGQATYDVSLFVDEHPEENSKHETHESFESGGGPAANAAVLLSRWGLRCAFAGLVGDDVYGRRIRDEFIEAGTDVSLLELRTGHPSPLSMILVSRHNGSRTLVNRKGEGAALQLTAETLKPYSPRLLLFDGHELEASLLALSLFPDAVSILDAGSWREGTAQLACKVRYLAASERFAKQATGIASLLEESHQRLCLSTLRNKFRATTIVTLGERGLIYDDGSGFVHLPAFAVKAVDTTAAGDIFHGALAYALIEAMPLPQALRLSSMTAALSVEKPGGRASIPALTTVEKSL
ncbi:MAG: hypothetical protein JWO08_3114 [Verrucomicrobiaceae bacterium]|nr:hypothetical protein [Verrucomicrobiaceae bacterium]